MRAGINVGREEKTALENGIYWEDTWATMWGNVDQQRCVSCLTTQDVFVDFVLIMDRDGRIEGFIMDRDKKKKTEYPRTSDLKKLCSSVQTAQYWFSWFILGRISLSQRLKAQFAHHIPTKKKLNNMCVNVKTKKKQMQGDEVTTVYLSFIWTGSTHDLRLLT